MAELERLLKRKMVIEVKRSRKKGLNNRACSDLKEAEGGWEGKEE